VTVRADDKPAPDAVKLDGKTLAKVNPDDAKLLGVLARGLSTRPRRVTV
jgi:hypothetical protein